MDYLDAILYINLAHRTDRNEHILHEIKKICKDESKIHRIDAVKKDPGALGCSLSHINVLQCVLDQHPSWNKILVLEDDFTFFSNDGDEIEKAIRLLSNYENLDVGLLSHGDDKFQCDDTDIDTIKKVKYSQTTSSYIITRKYMPTLLQNMRESASDMIHNGKRHHNCLDIHWTILQPHANWLCLHPPIGYQYDNYSDIEQRVVCYKC